MKIIRKNEALTEARPDGRTVRTLMQFAFDTPMDSAVLYHVEVSQGRFGAHYHAKSVEFIWFPSGGKITVNGQTYDMGAWDGVALDPGDIHGYDEGDCGDIIHFAMRFPDLVDKIDVE